MPILSIEEKNRLAINQNIYNSENTDNFVPVARLRANGAFKNGSKCTVSWLLFSRATQDWENSESYTCLKIDNHPQKKTASYRIQDIDSLISEFKAYGIKIVNDKQFEPEYRLSEYYDALLVNSDFVFEGPKKRKDSKLSENDRQFKDAKTTITNLKKTINRVRKLPYLGKKQLEWVRTNISTKKEYPKLVKMM